MRIRCNHGYFFFEEEGSGELSKFSSMFEMEFAPKDGYWTFKDLEEAPEYSLVGQLYLGSPALKTFAGRPWEVMRENELIYNFATGLVVPIDTVLTRAQVYRSQYYFYADGLLLPGSLNSVGLRVTEYTARYIWEAAKFRYTEVIYE